ncbi:hypothetical protein [Candidatus Hecatella orcuttiae]|uniref:hypothetical protein n=1 Tax=Candidatus Hecatella orcuttiae TaxID=1935119 RepID=UPI0028681132|nr:hypothetical protein [Candidatus Hecatella orcuttiae]
MVSKRLVKITLRARRKGPPVCRYCHRPLQPRERAWRYVTRYGVVYACPTCEENPVITPVLPVPRKKKPVQVELPLGRPS